MSSLTKRVWTNGKLTEQSRSTEPVPSAPSCTTMRSGPCEPDERWVGHVVHMEDGRIPKDLLYGKLAEGKRPTARPQLRYKKVCKRDLKALDVDLTTWEAVVSDWTTWRQTVH